MTTMTVEPTADVADLLAAARRLTNPQEKLRRAALAIEQAEREIEPRTLRRNAAAVIMFRLGQDVGPGEEPMQPAAMWRDTLVVSRSGWHKIVNEANPARIPELRAELDRMVTEIIELDTDRAAELPRLMRERDKLARKIARHVDQVTAVQRLQAEIDADPEVGKRLLAIAREEATEVHRLEALIGEAKKLRDELAVGLLNGSFGRPLSNSLVGELSKLSSARVAQFRDIRHLA